MVRERERREMEKEGKSNTIRRNHVLQGLIKD